jgi:hypothetical protein
MGFAQRYDRAAIYDNGDGNANFRNVASSDLREQQYQCAAYF